MWLLMKLLKRPTQTPHGGAGCGYNPFIVITGF